MAAEPESSWVVATASLAGLDPGVAPFRAALAAAPGDRTAALVLADWLRDERPAAGVDLEYALRFMAAAGKYPHRRTDVRREQWVWLYNQPNRTRHYNELTGRLAKAAPHAALPRLLIVNTRLPFPTWGAAVTWLAVTLGRLRRLCRVPLHAMPE